MSWKCLFFGCTWGSAYAWKCMGVNLKTCTCQRCGSMRTETTG